MKNQRRLVITLGVSVLSACGGGGGGGPAITPFQSFSAVQAGQTVEATGVSQSMAVTSELLGRILEGADARHGAAERERALCVESLRPAASLR